MAERRLASLRHGDHSREVRELREQVRRRRGELRGPLGDELALEAAHLDLLERPQHHQAVDEKAVALGRGHPAGGGVRARDVAELLQVGHHVAHRRGRQVEAGVLRQRAGADRLPLDDVTLDQRLQQVLGTGIQHGRPILAEPGRAWRSSACPSLRHRTDGGQPPSVWFNPRHVGGLRPVSTHRAGRPSHRGRRGDPRPPGALPRRPRPRGGARGGNRAHGRRRRPPHRSCRRDRREHRPRHRAGRRRHHAVDRTAPRAPRRPPDRHQPGAARLPHRHFPRPHGAHARGDARGTLRRGAPLAARRDRVPLRRRAAGGARAERRRRQSRLARHDDRMRGRNRRSLRVRDARRRHDRRHGHGLDGLRTLRRRSDPRPVGAGVRAGAGSPARAHAPADRGRRSVAAAHHRRARPRCRRALRRPGALSVVGGRERDRAPRRLHGALPAPRRPRPFRDAAQELHWSETPDRLRGEDPAGA